MSQQIQASIPSPVAQAVAAPSAAPVADQGSTAYPQWVAQTNTPAVASVTTAQAPSQATLGSAPSISNPYNQSQSAYSPNNPWEAAMGSLERVVSRMSPFPSQTAQSPQYATTQQATQQYSQPSQAQPWAYQAPTAAPTYSNNVSTTQPSSQVSTARSQAPQLSDATAQVVNHFGIEAPGILNQYSVTLEDALIAQNERMNAYTQRGAAMEHILTDPDQLADYTNRFFTEVYPVDADNSGYPAQQPAAYQPRYDMPAVPAANGAVRHDPDTQWNGFSQTMNQNPEQAWRYLSQMSPDAFRQKLLFLDAA
jgi:hypothetical protein